MLRVDSTAYSYCLCCAFFSQLLAPLLLLLSRSIANAAVQTNLPLKDGSPRGFAFVQFASVSDAAKGTVPIALHQMETSTIALAPALALSVCCVG